MRKETNMKRIILGVATAVVAIVGLASPASAHTPHHDVNCERVRLWATAYQGGSWSITVNGQTAGGNFQSAMDQSVGFPAYGDHSWAVAIDAPGTQYDYSRAGTQQGCAGPETTTTTEAPPSTTTTTAPTSSTTTTIPTESTSTSAPTTTAPETTSSSSSVPEPTSPPSSTSTPVSLIDPPVPTPTATHDVTCERVRLRATGYVDGAWTIAINGVEVGGLFEPYLDESASFGTSGTFSWTVAIQAPGTDHDYLESGFQQACPTPAPTPVATELPVTGAKTTTALVGAVLLACGMSFVLIARRR